jgi:16S rRNA (uracil1498-N3)-methyltransferase
MRMAQPEAPRASGHRFYIHRDAVQDGVVCITGPQARQICRVLRLRAGDTIRIFHGTAVEYQVRLREVTAGAVRGEITGMCEPTTECACRLWLAVPLLKSEKLEWVIQKSVELGACGVILTQTRRTVVTCEEDRSAGRLERYRRIAVEATEQCGRLEIPPIEGPVPWAQALGRAGSVEKALLADGEARVPLRSVSAAFPPFQSGILYTGPEGGFAPEELAAAAEAGVTAVSLGPRTLRAETAAIAAIALLLVGG